MNNEALESELAKCSLELEEMHRRRDALEIHKATSGYGRELDSGSVMQELDDNIQRMEQHIKDLEYKLSGDRSRKGAT